MNDKIKEIKDLLNMLPEEQRKFAIFKIFIQYEDSTLGTKIYDELSKDIKGLSKLYLLSGVVNS